MRIAIIRTYSIKSHMISHPLRVFGRLLAEHDLRLSFFSRVDDPRIADHDAVLILESDIRSTLPEGRRSRDGEIELVTGYRERGQAVVWFDESASSGMVRDYLLPYVDLYLKTQLVKDRSWYTRESPYGIYFRDFYHRQYDVEDDKTNPRDPVKPEHLNKLWLGWNIGLADLDILGRPRPITHLLYRLPRVRYKVKVVPPNLQRRSIDVLYRVSRATGKVDTFRFQRVEMRKHLDRLREAHPMFRYHMDGKVPKKVYDREMTDAVIIPSPFGDGATCYRDFEAILSGGVLLKADMGHLDMRPNFYIPGVTYIPHDWDFSDFAGKVLHILEHRSEYEAMALAAQETYLKALSPEGGEDFALQFKEIVQEARARRSGSLRSA